MFSAAELSLRGVAHVYYAFDILIHEGQSLTTLPLVERRAILGRIVEPDERVALSLREGRTDGNAAKANGPE